MNKIEWYPSDSAPELFPVEIISGGFILEDDSFVPLPLRQFVSTGWGKKGSTYLVGRPEKAIPTRLKITWLSYTEKQIYTGSFELSWQKLKKAFDDGFFSPLDNKQNKYKFIVAGMSPLGYISIWLNGDGISSEIDHFKCEIDKSFDLGDFLSENETLENYIQSQIKYSKPELLQISNLFTQQFSNKWNLLYRKDVAISIRVVTFVELISIDVAFFNGEDYNLIFGQDKIITIDKVPKSIFIKWARSEDDIKTSGCTFDEMVIFDSIDVVAKELEGILEMVIQLSEIDGTMKVFLKNQLSFIKLH